MAVLQELRDACARGVDPIDYGLRCTLPLGGIFSRRYRDPVFDAWMRQIWKLRTLSNFDRFMQLRRERLTPEELAAIDTEERDL